ncbi:hypothetical protein SERLA73DRAFT_189137 [Serpula lacrymans var. lacrymans S7.3]|uniref:Uncharacterized protein n=2 Tax=Serpula lacrymans var. lacrymans TaxID=341189 RepID=F8QCX1_SERL3|nr:uncharacterized protein SERLADRAFT_479831 [Serpula lacrymans var. lacrymans S7.9]EGN93986.1 hypothetical protein SERLA73DRAFT_189137 [Serpula lacrymans var. lacrymans S7.3]EGO19348.1 hypothetical protein SERLADRAFT_479831 [Serpula lacrymans var. lacrymans S7.9]
MGWDKGWWMSMGWDKGWWMSMGYGSRRESKARGDGVAFSHHRLPDRRNSEQLHVCLKRPSWSGGINAVEFEVRMPQTFHPIGPDLLLYLADVGPIDYQTAINEDRPALL